MKTNIHSITFNPGPLHIGMNKPMEFIASEISRMQEKYILGEFYQKHAGYVQVSNL